MRTLLYSVVPAVLMAASAAAAQQAPSGDQMVEQLLREPAAAEQPADEPDCSTEEKREANQACWQAVEGDSRGFSLAAPAGGAAAQKKWQKVEGAERGFSLGSKASRGTSGSRASASTSGTRNTVRPRATAARPAQVASVRTPTRSYAAAVAGCAADEVSGSGLNLCATFNSGSSTLSERTRKTLDELAARLTADPRLASRRFVISGHADASGDPGRNLALSRERAQAVVDYLASRGVPAARLTAEGRGAEEPINGRAPTDPMNRRVQIRAAS